VKIRLKMSFPMFHNHLDVKRGDVIEIDDVSGNAYCRNGVAEPYGNTTKGSVPPVEKAVAPEHETATVEVPVDAPKPLDEDEDDDPRTAAAPPKPGSRPTPARRR
jgi:hypothetical protein